MEKIDFKKENIPFTQVANGVIYDKKLSLGAKAVYAFMYSKPDGWQFSAYRIGQELSVSKTTVLKHLQELKDSGYLLSQKLPDGRMLYKVIFPPIEPESKEWTLGVEPKSKKATVQKSHGAESSPISNKEIIVIKRTSNTTAEQVGEDIKPPVNEFIELFKDLNPTYSYLFKRKDNRASAERLLKLKSIDEWSKIITFLVKCRTHKYCPRITTPSQLEQKYSELLIFANNMKEEKLKTKIAF